MLKNKIMLFLLSGVLLFGASSCEKSFDEVNINPDQPSDVPPALLLAGAEGDVATTQAGDMARFIAMITQQATGTDRQFIALNSYSYTNDAFDPMWKNAYAGHLNNLSILIKKADDNGYNVYAGVARSLTAYTLIQMTDLFGSMPYSEAFQGTKNLQPKFQTQEEIYGIAQSMLDDAIANLKNADPGVLTPGADDIIYGGDASKWIKFAHTLKARAYLHWAKKDNSNYAKALAELNNPDGAILSREDDARFTYFGGQPGGAPMFQFIAQRGGYLAPNDTYGAILTETGDNLRNAFYNIDFEDGHPYFTESQSVGLLTATEAQFIIAECASKTGAAATAATAFQAGIASSMADAGVTDAAGVASYIAAQPAAPSFEDIMKQKYLALYCDPEVFSDWRRTGIPALSPTAGTAVPRRFLYPTSEINLNSNTPSATLTDRVSWDVQ